MARYVPEAAEVSAYPEAARGVVDHWEAHSRNGYWEFRLAAWVARWNLRQAAGMTAGEQVTFDSDYMNAIKSEKNRAVLLALAQMNPSGLFPLGKWVRHLLGGNYGCRLAAGVAIHRWLVEVMEGASGEW